MQGDGASRGDPFPTVAALISRKGTGSLRVIPSQVNQAQAINNRAGSPGSRF